MCYVISNCCKAENGPQGSLTPCLSTTNWATLHATSTEYSEPTVLLHPAELRCNLLRYGCTAFYWAKLQSLNYAALSWTMLHPNWAPSFLQCVQMSICRTVRQSIQLVWYRTEKNMPFSEPVRDRNKGTQNRCRNTNVVGGNDGYQYTIGLGVDTQLWRQSYTLGS